MGGAVGRLAACCWRMGLLCGCCLPAPMGRLSTPLLAADEVLLCGSVACRCTAQPAACNQLLLICGLQTLLLFQVGGRLPRSRGVL